MSVLGVRLPYSQAGCQSAAAGKQRGIIVGSEARVVLRRMKVESVDLDDSERDALSMRKLGGCGARGTTEEIEANLPSDPATDSACA